MLFTHSLVTLKKLLSHFFHFLIFLFFPCCHVYKTESHIFEPFLQSIYLQIILNFEIYLKYFLMLSLKLMPVCKWKSFWNSTLSIVPALYNLMKNVTNLWAQKINDEFCSTKFLYLSQELFECAGNSKQWFFKSKDF